MKVLVVGQGGREHAIVRALLNSTSPIEVHALPGSDGIAENATCHKLDLHNIPGIVDFCVRQKFDYVFIGPEDPLVAGLSDALREKDILVVGPSQESARLEGSKIYAKEFMREAKIPTAEFSIVTSVESVLKESKKYTPPYVLKADGLAAGKGVYICKTLPELQVAAEDLFVKKIFGASGTRALLEQFTPGWELSFIILTNGSEYQALPIAQDHKRLLEKDEGPNTGGMGTVAPLPIPQKLREQIESRVVKPTLEQLQKRNMLYRGVIFFGVMVTPRGISLMEYNCRLGDPETQSILPLIEEDLNQVFYRLAQGQMTSITTKKLTATCVILAAPGYPQSPKKDIPIEGTLESKNLDSYFLHAGTQRQGSLWVTRGGRVLCAVGLGKSFELSNEAAYKLAHQVRWPGMQFRKDIGKKLPLPADADPT